MLGADLHGVPAIEVELVSEILNGFDFEQQKTFGDLIAAAIVRNFKAAQGPARFYSRTRSGHRCAAVNTATSD